MGEVTVTTPIRPLVLTGERTAPGIWHENYWFRRHEVVYACVTGWLDVPPAVVLDAGSGEGYAAALFGTAWPEACVLGVDYDAVAVAHAGSAYGGRNTAYVRGALTALPLRTGVADATVSLQVLEHIWTPAEFVHELARVTASGGLLVLSTPNRLTFSPGLPRLGTPPSAYHVREYDPDELGRELRRWLPGWELVLHGVRLAARLRQWEEDHGSLAAAQQASEPAQWSPELATVVRSVARDDFVLGEPDDTCLDLVAVLHPPRSRALATDFPNPC